MKQRESRLAEQREAEAKGRAADALTAEKRQKRLTFWATLAAGIAACLFAIALWARQQAREQTTIARTALIKSLVQTGAIERQRGRPAIAACFFLEAADAARDLADHKAPTPLARSPRIFLAAADAALAPPILHEASVLCLAVGADGKTLVTGSKDKTAQIWDLTQMLPIGQPLKHANRVDAVAVSPANNLFATVCMTTVHLWRLEIKATAPDISKHYELKHDHDVAAIAFGPDGDLIITASKDSAVIWSAQAKQRRSSMIHDGANVNSVSVNRDGTAILTGSADGSICLWDVNDPAKPKWRTVPDEMPAVIVLSSNANHALIGSVDGVVRVLNVTNRECVPVLSSGPEVRDLAFEPGGNEFAVALADGYVKRWSMTNEPLGQPLRHNDQINKVVYSSDGRFIATASRDGTARVWDTKSGDAVGQILRHDSSVYAVSFVPSQGSENAKRRAVRIVTCSSDFTARVWTVSESVEKVWESSGVVWAVATDLDNRYVAIGGDDGCARILDVQSGKWKAPIEHSMGPRNKRAVFDVAFCPDRQYLLTGCNNDKAQRWNVEDGTPLGDALQHDDGVRAVAISPDGRWIATGTRFDRYVRLWEVASTRGPDKLAVDDSISRLAFSWDSRRLAVARRPWFVDIWDVSMQLKKRCSHSLEHDGAVFGAVFHPSEPFLYTASWDGYARSWDVQSGELAGLPLLHSRAVTALAISRTGDLIATGSGDGTVCLWNHATQQMISERRVGEFVRSLAFSADDHWIWVASDVASGGGLFRVNSPPPAIDDPERLRLSVEVRTGMRIKKKGTIEQLTVNAWLDVRQKLKELGGPCDTPTWVEYNAWKEIVR